MRSFEALCLSFLAAAGCVIFLSSAMFLLPLSSLDPRTLWLSTRVNAT